MKSDNGSKDKQVRTALGFGLGVVLAQKKIDKKKMAVREAEIKAKEEADKKHLADLEERIKKLEAEKSENTPKSP